MNILYYINIKQLDINNLFIFSILDIGPRFQLQENL